jgi:hypothetical protein
MKKIAYILLITFLLLSAVCFGLYKFNPVVRQMVDIQLMNMKEITQFEVKGSELYMNNLINSQTYNQLRKILEANPQITTLVEEIVPGSIDDDTMIKLAYYIREKGLNTKLLSYSAIDSGGVDLFLAGNNRTMEKGAHIGVHSWSDGINEAKDIPKNDPAHEKNRKYIEDMLGKDDFYWFTIYAAPAEGVKELTEEEIKKYNLLSKDILTENLTKTKFAPGILASKFESVMIGNAEANTIIIVAQGGPVTTFGLNEANYFLVEIGKVDTSAVGIINAHQEQTLMPWLFKKEITFEQAKSYDKNSVKYLTSLINYFKSKHKTVYVVGVSFGAFVTQASIAEYGNIADKYLIMVGRLDMPEAVWREFAAGNFVGFSYDKGTPSIVKLDADGAGMGGENTLEDQNMAKLAAGLGYKRYTQLLKDKDLSNVIYVYGKKDQQVGRLSQQEVGFLKSKNAEVFAYDGGHGETIAGYINKGIKLLFKQHEQHGQNHEKK